MAKDVITRLKLETTAYDSKLRDAAKGLADYTKTATNAGKEFGKFTQSNVEAARALGNITPSATNAKDKVKELVGAFNEAAKAYNHLTKEQQQSDFAKAMAESLGKLKVQIAEAKQELYGMGDAMKNAGGKDGFLSGIGDKTSGMLQVFGGNLLAEGVSRLTSELVGSVQESIELARQGEGIRIAFERLNQPGLLDELKAATHGTVSEIELMQQAIKFENFKLPVEDLANYLAFAQQKAKDTGESIDYLVNSIVTGLGRQSKQILDNLGISAAELTRRMNEGATMTQAVSDIIREEMAKAGDYVETAADRAARATADTKNKMEELGRSAMPVAEEFASAWTEIRNGAMSLVLPVLSTVADSIRDIREILGGEWDMPKLKPGIQNLADGPAKGNQPKKPTWGDVPVVTAPGGYVEVTDKSGNVLHGGHYDSEAQLQAMMKRWNTTTTRRGGSRTPKQSIEDMLLSSFLKADRGFDADSLRDTSTGPSKLWEMMRQEHYANLKPEQLMSRADFEEGRNRAKVEIENREGDKRDDPLKEAKKQNQYLEGIGSDISGVLSGLEKMGIEIPEGLSSVVGGIQMISGIVSSILTLVGVISALTSVKSVPIFGWLLAQGGIAGGFGGRHPIHAAGGTVAGNTYSGDQIPAMLNAGEVVLSQAQAGILASRLQGDSGQMQLETTITGEQIRLVLNNNGRRTGRGEYVTSNRR